MTRLQVALMLLFVFATSIACVPAASSTGGDGGDGGSGGSGGSGGGGGGGGSPAPDASVPWNSLIGAHYASRAWARGGLRDPGGAGTAYRSFDGGLQDDGFANFQRTAVPELRALLSRGEYAVIQAGLSTAMLEAITTTAGRAAFARALGDRIDLIHAMPEARGWETRVVVQFGNEIQNAQGFYGSLCRYATMGRTDQCDLETEFAPAYVDRYLAPGVEILREKSQALFGRPDAIRIALGSVVNLVSRRAFVETLLRRRVGGTAAPTLVGQPVSSLVDTVTIHYTMNNGQAPALVDDFFHAWTSPDAGTTVRSLWMTEEVGVSAGRSGYGFAAALRAIAPSLRWWKSRGLDPSRGHLFIWGADQRCEVDAGGCLSVDDAMPIFADFVGSSDLVETSDTTVTSSQPLTVFSYRAGPDRRVVLAWANGGVSTNVSAINLDTSDWTGRQLTPTLRKAGIAGLPQVPVVESGSTYSFSTTLVDREVLMFFLEAR
ncbi:MAG: hypothetical protein Q8L48_27710 [Archangium sp.]|nr:hypothetical protein [Archangium sp.]